MFNNTILIAFATALAGGTASAATFREQSLLGVDAISCSEAAEAMGDTASSREFMELGTFVFQHIYSNYDQWQPSSPEHLTMPGIFTVLTEGKGPPLSENGVRDLTYHTVEFFKGSLDSQVALKGKNLDAGSLFTLKRDLARDVWEELRCEAIKELYL